MATFPVPTTLTSREQATLASVPGYSGKLIHTYSVQYASLYEF